MNKRVAMGIIELLSIVAIAMIGDHVKKNNRRDNGKTYSV